MATRNRPEYNVARGHFSWEDHPMNAKSLCWCLLALTVAFLASPNLGAQTADDTGSKWKLEQAMREEARLISSGNRIYGHEPPTDIVRGLHELTEQRRRAPELEREEMNRELEETKQMLRRAEEKLKRLKGQRATEIK
jgi:hypothetical protein